MLPRVNLIRTDETDYLLFSTRDAISLSVYLNGIWAQPLLQIAKTFLHQVEEPFVIDVGANLGAFAVPIAQGIASTGGTVFAFEPQRIIYQQLCGNVFLNRLDNVHAFNAAIGDTNGFISIPNINYEKIANIGAFTLDPNNPNADDFKKASVLSNAFSPQVPISTLDSVTLPKAPSLIKIDVELLELQVLKGATGTLERHDFPPLMMEVFQTAYLEHRDAVEGYLHHLGYNLFRLGDEVIAQHPRHGIQVEFKYRSEGVLEFGRVR
jgi:FkbM family methyltransferase